MSVQSDGSRFGAAEPSSISSTLLDQIRARRPDAWQRLVCGLLENAARRSPFGPEVHNVTVWQCSLELLDALVGYS
jgi:hypothetical protein